MGGSGFLEKLYNSAPFWAQNCICSLYGVKLYRERYSTPWSRYYSDLLYSEGLGEDALVEFQKNKFVELLKSAKRDVGYYRDVLPAIFQQGDSSLQELSASVPVLEKDVFRTNLSSFLSQNYDTKKLVKVNTSGTTGTPMTIYLTPQARKMNYAFFARSKRWAGIDGFERSITFAGRLIVPQEQHRPPYWRTNYFFRNTLFSSYHISSETVPLYIGEIRHIQPYFIDAYPSSLYPLAQYILAEGITSVRPKAIITSAETLLEHQRDVIERAFGCKIYDQYGSAEQVVFACQCEHGSYHLNPEFGYLEVVDKHNGPVGFGELGEFVCTGFTNDAMPLIRYKIGDMGILSKKKCACGRNFPVIEKIVGRMDDILITPDGKYVGRLDPIFKGMSNSIKETQIIQQASDFVEILIVKADGYVEDDGQSVITELKKRMGERIFFKIKYVDEIPRTANGKFRTVVNNSVS